MARGPLLLDAAMGTRLLERGLQLTDDDPVFWNLSRPEIVAEIHRRDVEAGAKVLLTNTFGANQNWLRRFGRTADLGPINQCAVALARQEAGVCRFVLGSISPVASELPGTCREQAELLIEAGVDALLLETHQLDQALIALGQLTSTASLPILVSLFAWPDSPDEAVHQLEDLGAAAVGLNCVAGMPAARRMAEALRQVTRLPLIVKPSAGIPGIEPLASPASFAEESTALLALAPIMVGGCCGTNESHVAALRAAWYHG